MTEQLESLTEDEGAEEDSTFGEAIPLPRGPNKLTEKQIAESQRIRLMAAITEILAENGWGGLTIGDIVGRAGVSRSAFYDHFTDKEDCLIEAYAVYAERVLKTAMESLDSTLPWEEFSRQALSGYLNAVQSDPVAARAFTVEMDSAGPKARQVRLETIKLFAAVMEEAHRTVREQDPSLAGSSGFTPRVYLGTALGVRELIREELTVDPQADVTELVDDIVTWVTAMLRGAE